MTFWQVFFRLLPKRPSKALGALYWRATGRKVRAENRLRAASVTLPLGYDLWISNIEKAGDVLRSAPETIESWTRRPRFLMLIHQDQQTSSEQLLRSIYSIERQIYPNWFLGDSEGGNDTLANADYVVLLRSGDSLSKTALFRFAEAIQACPSASILFGDHDELNQQCRRSRPWFKPQWNAELFNSLDYISQFVAVERDLARTADLVEDLTDLDSVLLKVTDKASGPIVHIPHILGHVDPTSTSSSDTRRDAVSQHVQKRGASATPGPHGTTTVRWPLPDAAPKVSIIIPTRDKVELLRACVESVLKKTSYPNFEIIVVDNGSMISETLSFFNELANEERVRVLHYSQPYNFSAINNFAAQQADGAFLCLLNNDTEVVEADWLTELMRYAVRPDIGAVGAKLLYSDGSIQHAGVVVGMGDAAGHPHRFLPAGDPGYFRQAHAAQFVTAVTAACLVVEKVKFDSVGGLDAQDLAIAYNDVDLCLKLQSMGLKNVYVPHAILLHHETQSRGHDLSPHHLARYARELKVFQDRWGTKAFQDPLHNPNLDRYSETYVIRI